MKYLKAFGMAAEFLLIYGGLTLSGWGFSDLAGYFSLAPRVGYLLAMAGYALAMGYQVIVAPMGIIGSPGDPKKRLLRQTVVSRLVMVYLFVMSALLSYADRRGLGVLPAGLAGRWIGVFLVALGYGLVFWSGWALGRMYSAEVTIQKDHHLITSGPYGLIRHPQYLGLMLLALGAALLFRSWIGLALSVPFIALLLWRIGDEEMVMHKEFGLAWEAYCRRSRRLIPFVY